MSAGSPRRPLTEPAEFWLLVGRFTSTLVLYLLFLMALFRREWTAAVFLGVAALVVQRAMIGLYRRLRRERAEAVAARAAEPEAAP